MLRLRATTTAVAASNSKRRWAAILLRTTQSDAGEELRRLLRERSSVKSFASDPVPNAVLTDILDIVQRAPTGFNMQPYAVVLVREQADRDRLAEAMLASNGRKVKEAPVVAVFAADLEPSRRVPRIQKMMYDNGASAAEINNLPHYLRLFSGEGHLAGGIRSLISTVVSPLQAVPAPVPTIAWSFKQTAFAASAFLHAAHSYSLATCPMEGFDEQRLKNALDIPDRYSIPVVIACGYRKPEDASQSPRNPSPRLQSEEVFFDGKFGHSSAHLFDDSKQ